MDTTDIEEGDTVIVKPEYANKLSSSLLYTVCVVKGNAALIERNLTSNRYWIPLHQLEKVDPEHPGLN